MMLRLRLRGKSIGQIDDALLEEYKIIEPYRRLNFLIEMMIGREILHYTVANVQDLDLAEEYVKNLRYRNIGEYLDDYMRKRLLEYFEICQNCYAYKKDFCEEKNVKTNPYAKGCGFFAKE